MRLQHFYLSESWHLAITGMLRTQLTWRKAEVRFGRTKHLHHLMRSQDKLCLTWLAPGLPSYVGHHLPGFVYDSFIGIFFFLSLRPDWIFIPITVWCHVPRTIGGYVEDTDGRQATRVPLGKQDQHPQSKKLMTGTYIKWYTWGKSLKVVILSIHES